MKALFPLLASAALLATPAFAADTYKIDPSHTSVDVQYTHLGFSHPVIRFMSADGTITLDEKDPSKSQVNVSIDVTKVNSGVEVFDGHLKSGNWFNVEKFPKATFVSTKVVVTGENTADVTGDLTIKGVTKSVTLKVKLNKKGLHPMLAKSFVGFTATAQLKRSDFDLGAYAPAVSDEFEMRIEVEAGKE